MFHLSLRRNTETMNTEVRVRFAPSPTGPLHIGGVRTALYNYLFARKNKGKFLLRLEDTDQTRFVPGAEQYIIDALTWCGIVPDEGVAHGGEDGPYRQSERKSTYSQYTDQLIASGHAYYAFDTPQELEKMREDMKRAGVAAPQYNAISRSNMKNSLTLSSEEVAKRLENNEPYVIRIKIPRNEEIRFQDEIRGWVTVHTSNIDDKVLFKSDGMPTYHLANVADDHAMRITHVIRGEEWLPSAPLHVLLYRVLGWESSMPKFAHLPLILRPDGNGKLSKRDGDRLGFPVFPLDWNDTASGEKSSGFRERGYTPEAFLNILAFLGWNPGTTQELFSLQELCEAFSLDRVGKAGAKFDPDKAKWYNQQYLRQRSGKELVALVAPFVTQEQLAVKQDYLERACEIMKERATFPEDIINEGVYLFRRPVNYDEKTVKKKWKPETADLMTALRQELSKLEPFTATAIEECFKTFLENRQLGFGAVLPNLRLLLTGEGMGPSLFDIASLLGKEEALQRIDLGLKTLN
jgi:glutamyl-tRNA synthetase